MNLVQDKKIRSLLFIALLLNIGLWGSVRHVQSRWTNVPPAPQKKYAASYGLGDAQFSYRSIGIMIQNLGDTGGRTTALNDYNYSELVNWFFLEDYLDPHSNFVPYIAAYYFGGVQQAEKFRPVLDYLKIIGQRPEPMKWRFLVQAIFLARFEMKDLNKALELAQVLGRLDASYIPHWTKQMPAFIMTAQGKKEAAYALMLQIIKTESDKMVPNELNAMRAYICERILEKTEADLNPLCKDIP